MRPRQLGRSQIVFAACVIAGWTVVLLAAAGATGSFGQPEAFNLPLWTAEHLPTLWLDPVARGLGGGFRPATDADLDNFFSRASALAAREQDLAYARAIGGSDPDAEAAIRAERAAMAPLRGPVALRLSGELSTIIREQGLGTALPPYDRAVVVWPPVNFAYDLPPNLLIRSRRDRIELIDTELLRPNLPDPELNRLVVRAQNQGQSALTVRIGGIATYPSIVEDDDTYRDTLEVIAHEWVHQYLFFHPLGIRYFAGRDLTTINETVANIAGQELAATMRARFPLAATTPSLHTKAPPPDRSVNFDRTLHELRLQVDALLASGNVDEAEARMNETQRFLAEHGYYVPKINQAYFAFYGTYANTAASSSPLGPKLAAVRRRYAGLGAFMHAIENVESADDLDRLLAAGSS